MSSSRIDFEVELIERDLITVVLTTVDVLPGTQVTKFSDLADTEFVDLQNKQFARYNSTTGKWENVTLDIIIEEHSVFNETPNKLSTTQFQTNFAFLASTLRVFLNGIKEKHVVVDGSTLFSFDAPTEIGDIVEVNYIKDV